MYRSSTQFPLIRYLDPVSSVNISVTLWSPFLCTNIWLPSGISLWDRFPEMKWLAQRVRVFSARLGCELEASVPRDISSQNRLQPWCLVQREALPGFLWLPGHLPRAPWASLGRGVLGVGASASCPSAGLSTNTPGAHSLCLVFSCCSEAWASLVGCASLSHGPAV